MGQAREVCPHCGRKPGQVHGGKCPRSTDAQKALASWAASAGQGRLVIEDQAPGLQSFLRGIWESENRK